MLRLKGCILYSVAALATYIFLINYSENIEKKCNAGVQWSGVYLRFVIKS